MLVEIDVVEGIGCITLNRPEARNAISAEVAKELDAAIIELDSREDVGCMILTGADPAFCAGMDLRGLSTGLGSMSEARAQVDVERLGLMPVHDTPIIGAVNGPAVTGGLELALGCDFLIASERARFADTHARVGVMPGGGLTIRLPQLIGIDRARRMSFTGDFLDAETALLWGLVVEVTPHRELLGRARTLAAAIVGTRREHVRELRRTYDDIGALLGHEAWARESQLARHWIATQFDRGSLADRREEIIERGRSQAS